jgi:hypothetical protein
MHLAWSDALTGSAVCISCTQNDNIPVQCGGDAVWMHVAASGALHAKFGAGTAGQRWLLSPKCAPSGVSESAPRTSSDDPVLRSSLPCSPDTSLGMYICRHRRPASVNGLSAKEPGLQPCLQAVLRSYNVSLVLTFRLACLAGMRRRTGCTGCSAMRLHLPVSQ